MIDACISGVGQSDIARRLDRDPLEFTLDACLAAIEHAGLTRDDIDGLSTYPGPMAVPAGFSGPGAYEVIDALRLNVDWYDSGLETSGQLGSVMKAALAVGAGLCNHVVCFRSVWEGSAQGEKGRSAVMPGGGGGGGGGGFKASGYIEWTVPFSAPSAAIWIAMFAQAHFHRYGTTKEQLAWIALNGRRNAALNPRAIYREPMTLDDYLASRIISTPFSLYDCDVPCDGATAVIVSRADRARDLRNQPLRIEAMGGGIHDRTLWDQPRDLTAMANRDAGKQLWSRTSLKPSDVQMLQAYDGFSFLTMSWIEALGFCEVGESGPFVEGGERIARDGQLPLNTHGGQLSAGRLHGYGFLHEAAIQMWDEGGDRQIAAPPEVGVAAAGGGNTCGCLLLVRDEEVGRRFPGAPARRGPGTHSPSESRACRCTTFRTIRVASARRPRPTAVTNARHQSRACDVRRRWVPSESNIRQRRRCQRVACPHFLVGFPVVTDRDEGEVMPAQTPFGRVSSLAGRQLGLFTRDDARRCGLTDAQRRRMVRDGIAERIAPAVFRFTGSAQSWHQRVLAACLDGGSRCVASHRTAAALHSFDGFVPGVIEVVVPMQVRHRRRDVMVHHTRDLPMRDICRISGIPVTTPIRTLLMLGAVVPADVVEEAYDALERDSKVDRAAVDQRYLELRRPGRTGIGAMTQLRSERSTGRAVPKSVLERRMLRLLVAAGLPLPRSSYWVHTRDGRAYELDFAYVAERLGLEVDGHGSHATRRQRASDNVRMNDLENDGWSVRRFTYEQVTSQPLLVAKTVREALERSHRSRTHRIGSDGA